MPEARITGRPDKPAIILGKKFLACYCYNFDLIFTTAKFGGEEVARVKLTDQVADVDIDDLNEWINTDHYHQEVFRIRVAGTQLYLAGFNFMDKSDPNALTDRYCVFALRGELIYYTLDYAKEIMATINDNIILEIV